MAETIRTSTYFYEKIAIKAYENSQPFANCRIDHRRAALGLLKNCSAAFAALHAGKLTKQNPWYRFFILGVSASELRCRLSNAIASQAHSRSVFLNEHDPEHLDQCNELICRSNIDPPADPFNFVKSKSSARH